MLTEEMVEKIMRTTGCTEDEAQTLCNAVDPDEYGIDQSKVDRKVADDILTRLLSANPLT